MASLSLRSSSKREGLSTRSTTAARNNSDVRAPTDNRNTTSSHSPTQHLPNTRKKRTIESADQRDLTAANKKPKLALEIHSKVKAKAPAIQSKVVNGDAVHNSRSSLAPSTKRKHTNPTKPEPWQSPPRTNHQQKVVNGIKHELGRLAPRAEDLKAAEQKNTKRSLRSQEGVRFKSDLSTYFPEYDEVIGNDPKEEHILNYDTPVIILDSAKSMTKPVKDALPPVNVYKEYPESLFTKLHNCNRVDFSFLPQHYRDKEDDPLSNAYFQIIHAKLEREAKKTRNGDKIRAEHERNEIIRLMEGLQGHEWLRVMGVSGITESKKKDYEPARRHFITGCELILDKFRTWKEEEKRRKLEKDQAKTESIAHEGSVASDDDPPECDVDASAARQLHEEATASCGPARKTQRSAGVESLPPLPATKNGERSMKSLLPVDGAKINVRRNGRSKAAWGESIPEVLDSDFDLPEEYRDEEVLRSHARNKRRERRVFKD
ncbi:something about silencing, SAS, complex subunit 4-domain-containing protein [Calycina marina]|uniref:Something about silencing, SAS, complex subunit 4-domain-containing protein n=1 Tax=Calycina marina TaxID=1763456 RepID=A0A9P7Z7L8_9HELO|nr:something about silencing, SAS, complex subunit 4-domain-containing protein [Calycina marina]